MLEQIIEYFQAYGFWGMIFTAFAEAVFLPMDPIYILAPLSLANLNRTFYYAFLCVVLSSVGAFVGYYLGKTVGYRILHRYFSAGSIEQVEQAFHRYGEWAVFLAVLTPLPSKVLNIVAGSVSMNVYRFMAASVSARSLKYFGTAFLVLTFGEQAISYFEKNSFLLIIVVIIICLALIIIYRNDIASSYKLVHNYLHRRLSSRKAR